MKSAKRIITACLTATLVFQALAPSTSALAEEVNAVSAFAASATNDSANAATDGGTDGASDGDKSSDTDDAAGGNASADASGEEAGSDQGDIVDGTEPSGDQDTSDNAQPSTANDAANPAAEQQDGVAVAANSQITTVEQLNAALGSYGSVESSGAKATKIRYKHPAALCIISNTEPSVYQTAVIEPDGITGAAFDLTVAQGGYSFEGFGSDAAPFQGSFSVGNNVIQVARSFYNNVELSDGNKDVKLTWKGTSSDPIVAKKLLGNGMQLDATISIVNAFTKSDDDTQESEAAITSALVGEASGSLSLSVSYSFDGKRKGIGIIATTDDNAGLLVNTLTKSSSLALVGVNGLESANENQTVTAANGNAGSLIGFADEESTVAVNTSVDVSKFTVKASGSAATAGAAGGFLGFASKLNLQFADGATVHPALKVGDESTNYAGGAIGSVSFAAGFTVSPTMFLFGDNGDSVVELGTKKRAGGLFGSLDVANGDVAIQGGTYKSKLVAAGDSNGSRGGYGGIAGNVCSSAAGSETVHALTINKSNDDQKVPIEIEKAVNLFYTGGVAGYVGDNLDGKKANVALVVDGAQVTCNGNAVAHDRNAKYGGAVGVVDTNQVLDVRDFKLKTGDGTAIGQGSTGGTAGIAGSAWRGIIKFSGTTDLSEAKFADNDRTAQLVYQNYNALIFATGSGSDGGWTYLRPNEPVAIDDIYDYGQVIRLGNGLSNNLINVNEATHKLVLGQPLSKTGDAYVLSTADDFAKLAITWQTFGYFSMVDGVQSTGKGYKNLLGSTIEISGIINLAGTGLTGIAKDRTPSDGSEYQQESGGDGANERGSAFSGALTGTGTINLAVGEPYGKRNDAALGADDTSNGNGKIYRHGRLGLFNELAGATIEGGVTIGGTMKFDAKSDVNAGALAAVRTGGATSVTGLTVTTAITYDNTDENRTENIGGIFGQVTGDGAMGFASGVSAKPTITSRVQDQGYVRAAAAIGNITKESIVTVNATDITIGGSITVSDYKKDTLVGGFIAYIRQDEASLTAGETKAVNIAGLSFDGFAMTVNAQNSSNKNSGGLLGYSWGNAVVDFTGTANKYALSTSNANVAAGNATGGFGGLVYAASGYWKINDYAIDLSGAKLSVPDANTFGVLVCRAGSSREANDKVGVDALTGLYLKNAAPWATAYKVSDSADAISTSATTFDEWVADTKRSGSKIDDILANGVISLHTQDETLSMSGDASRRNSYENRTAYGKNHQANPSARYYYNLDRAVEKASYNGNWITNAEGLLLWSAWRYAPSGVRNYVTEGLAAGNSSIQDTLRVDGDIDLTGYSYYPVGNNGGNAFLRGSLTFCYKEIAETEKGNKRNNELSQHSNMHLSVFGGFASSSKSNMTLMVGSDGKALTLKGTIGKDVISGNYGSGALISGSLVGIETSGTIAAVSTAGKGMVLDGLTVWTEGSLDDGGSSPLLVNAMPSYANLTVNNLSVKDGSYSSNIKAATSLFGTLGGSNADMVSASFSNISVPSLKDSSIFTHASFLESFGYKQGGTGSANYIFYEDDTKNNNVTYGSEIDANGADNEYVGKQLWYYDDVQPRILVTDGVRTASETSPAFGAYLPYVYKGKEGTAYHEIKVNQRVPSLATGCGTYGDPYVIKSASQISAVTSYINLGTAVDGWEVTIAGDQTALCNRRSDGSAENEITYVYKSGSWAQKDGTVGIDNDVMHYYLQSAYYSIEPEDSDDSHNDSIELDTTEFTGFGNKANPFRGVIVGGLKERDGKAVSTGLVIKNNGATVQGLIPYSYGSVVKDLDIVYSGSPATIAYGGKNSEDGVPYSFFGGIIGCILGGDNIIDGATVSHDGAFAVSAPEDDKSCLVPIGGYVGAVTGGGVIFRNITEDESWILFQDNVKSEASLYANPYVGRVIDGYAFSEGCDVDNSNKNYKVNKLTDKGTACVETGDCTGKYKGETDSAITTTVKNAQGLLVLSAIISSGAGGGSSYSGWAEDAYGSFNGSKAYAGRTTAASGVYLFGNDSLGKVRNAGYEYVGMPAKASDDFGNSLKDDRLAPGNQNQTAGGALDQADGSNVNSPYLVKNYATWQTGNVCAPKASGMDLQFAAGTYDMTGYGTGFTGLSGRYYSNACASGYGADRDRIVPQIACINGNGAKVLLKSDVKQYLYDDYFLQSWGGLFSAVEFTGSSVSSSLNSETQGGYLVRDLQLGDDSADAQSSSVSLTCIKSNGTSASYSDLASAGTVDKDSSNGVPHMGVGVLAGSTANREALSNEGEGKYKSVKLANCEVSSISMSGGLFGNSGWAKRRTDLDRNRMISFETQTSPVRLYDCAYSNLAVTGATRVGGFVGAVGGNNSIAGAWATASEVTMGADSTIVSTEKGSIIGGAFGLCWSTVKVNAADNGATTDKYKTLALNNVTVRNQGVINNPNSAFEGTGGLVGDPKEGCIIAQLTVGSDKSASDSNATCIQSTQTGQQLARRVGGIVGQIDAAGKDYKFTDVTVNNIKLSAHDSCGGIVGHIMGNNIKLVCDGVTIENVYVDGTYSGGIAGAIASGSTEISVTNSTIRNATFGKSENGGIAGDGRGKFLLTNVLFDKNAFTQSIVKPQGVILGSLAISDFRGIYASGIDIVPSQNATLPNLINASDSDIKKANQKSYIAFSDYGNTFDEVDGSSLYNDERAEDGSEVAVESASPYVTTNPVNNSVKLRAAESSSLKSIFGDGAAIDTAATIQNDTKSAVAGYYANIGGRADDGTYQTSNDYSASTSGSMFNANNIKGSKTAKTDFPVLLVSGNDSTTVTNYLNLVTNGGFSDAVRLNGDTKFVTATAERFDLSDDGSYFAKDDESPSLTVVNNGTSNMTFRASSSWDNEESRFTLLTVTFDNGSGHTYKVQVPIIVKRMLEIDFTATYMQGTDFKSADYDNKDLGHVLIGFGDTMTSYLSWTYGQAKGKPEEYGWNSHLESGGAMKSTDKVIEFKGTEGRGVLPEGTQLTLVDPSNNGKEYHYTVPEGGVSSVALSSFTDGNATYQEKWLSEIMGVEAVEDNSGAWIKIEVDEGESIAAAGARIVSDSELGFDYYRVAGSDDSGKQRYRLSVENEKPQTENFYLTVRVPESAGNSSINGYTTASVTPQGVNVNVNYRKRTNEEDGHINTPSTYSVDSNYTQEITDTNEKKDPEGSFSIQEMGKPEDSSTTYSLDLDVTDQISFGSNEYNDSDALYYQIDSSLEQFSSGSSVGAVGYPMGVSGDVSFYVTVGNIYYTWDGSKWNSAGTDSVAAVSPKHWEADGKDMSLVLSDSSGKAISLAGIREAAKNSGNAFQINMKASLSFTAVAAQAVIMMAPKSDSGTYTKPTYRGYLSPNEGTLSTSSMMQSNGGAMGYYLKDSGTSTIALVATKKTQLGINVNDLGSADGDIALVGTYDFSKLTGADSKLEKGDTITYTLALKRRNDDGSYSDVESDIGRYISIKESNLGIGSVSGSSIVFTDKKAEGKFATRDANSLACKLKFTVKVNTDVEENGFAYANYRLVLTANLSGDGQSDTPNNVDGAPDDYQHSDYVTYELTKVNTKGIDHQ